MFRPVLALLVVASVEASRVQVHRSSDAESKAKWASCDHLQNVFRDRVAAFQTFLEENPDLDAVSRAAQVSVVMKTYGIIRPLRRARECSWVVDEDGEEIEQARGIVQILLAGNPCAEAARSELESGTSAGTPQDEIQSVQRAVNVLSSETCEVGEMPEETIDEENVDAELRNAEDDLQDAIDECESSVSPEGAFIQTESSTGSVRGFMRGIGVAILMLLLLLACVGVVAVIGTLIAAVLGFLALLPPLIATGGSGGLGMQYMVVPYAVVAAGAVSGVIGLAGCAHQLYNQMLPRLTQ